MPVITQFTSDSELADWQGEFNSLLIGVGTPYELISIEGFDSPDIRDDSVDWMGQHGSFTNAQFYGSRTITITGSIIGDLESGEFAANVLALRNALVAQPAARPLRLNIAGWGTRVSFVSPMKFAMPTDTDFAIGYGQFAVQFKAGDPRLYDDLLQVLSTGPPTESGLDYGGVGQGLDYGGVAGVGLDYGGGYPAIVTTINSGAIDAPFVVSFIGPALNPQIINLTTGKALKFNINLGGLDELIVDTLARTVTLNGYANVYSALDPSSEWFNLGVGESDLKFIADSGPTGIGISTLMTVSFRNTWV